MLPLRLRRGTERLLAGDCGRAVILTYHAIDRGKGPLSIEPPLFRRHLDCIVESGASALTVSELAERANSGTIPTGAVAITFDDGFASVASDAAPMLVDR